MTYKLGTLPSKGANVSELADFLEVQCLLSTEKSYSITSAKSALCMADDTTIAGIDSEEDEILNDFSEALMEIEERRCRCRENYPFTAEKNVIKITKSDRIAYIYYFLLLATRERMGVKRIYSGIDGTLLFEFFCEIIIKNFFGEKAKTMIFGTSSELTFKEKIETLISALNIKGTFKEPVNSLGMQKDGKLDIVVWIPFTDKREGDFIGFGQCKTGNNWRDSVGQLNPKAFWDSYSTCSPVFTPVKIFLVAESCYESWEEITRYVDGLFFDRNRLMDFSTEMPTDLNKAIEIWVNSVIKQYN